MIFQENSFEMYYTILDLEFITYLQELDFLTIY